MNREIISILTLQGIHGLGKKKITKIISNNDIINIKSSDDLFELLLKTNFNLSIPPKEEIESLWKKSKVILNISTENKIKIISFYDPIYPSLLREIQDPPLLLHIKGNIDLLHKESVAVIGTRKISETGVKSTKELTAKLVDAGYCIISGLAKGTDSIAHETTLEKKGYTLAILGQGLQNTVYKKNISLEDRILKNKGAILSEYSFGTRPNKGFFIERDRLQSGLSRAVFVIETTVDGGTMHTANFCQQQGRPLFVFNHEPGSVNESSIAGNQLLLKQGAISFDSKTTIEDIKRLINKTKKKKLNTIQKKLVSF
jgi:DNA processing protein